MAVLQPQNLLYPPNKSISELSKALKGRGLRSLLLAPTLIWSPVYTRILLMCGSWWSNFVSSGQWSDKETSVNTSSTDIELQMYCKCSLYSHSSSRRHLLTTGDNWITRPDVSSLLHPVEYLNISYFSLSLRFIFNNKRPLSIFLPLRHSSNGLHICYET